MLHSIIYLHAQGEVTSILASTYNKLWMWIHQILTTLTKPDSLRGGQFVVENQGQERAEGSRRDPDKRHESTGS